MAHRYTQTGGPFSLDSIYWYLAFNRMLKPSFRPYGVCSLFSAVCLGGLQRLVHVLKLHSHASPDDVLINNGPHINGAEKFLSPDDVVAAVMS